MFIIRDQYIRAYGYPMENPPPTTIADIEKAVKDDYDLLVVKGQRDIRYFLNIKVTYKGQRNRTIMLSSSNLKDRKFYVTGIKNKRIYSSISRLPLDKALKLVKEMLDSYEA